MKIGVNMKIKDSDPKRIPNPIRNTNKPSDIGFLICAYKPVVINFGGGLKGTGVPLVRINASTVQPQMNQPTLSKNMDNQMSTQKSQNERMNTSCLPKLRQRQKEIQNQRTILQLGAWLPF